MPCLVERDAMHGRDSVSEYTEQTELWQELHPSCVQPRTRSTCRTRQVSYCIPESMKTFSSCMAAHFVFPIVFSVPGRRSLGDAQEWCPQCRPGATTCVYTLPGDSSHFPQAFHVGTPMAVCPQVTVFSCGECPGDGTFSFRRFSSWDIPERFFRC